MSTRTAIVTGASRGFGRATAIALVNAGVHVIGVGRDREQLDAVRNEAGAEFTPVAAVPGLNAGTALGHAAASAHAKREGVSLDRFLERLDPTLTPERVGQEIAALATGSEFDSGAYRVTANGLTPVD